MTYVRMAFYLPFLRFSDLKIHNNCQSRLIVKITYYFLCCIMFMGKIPRKGSIISNVISDPLPSTDKTLLFKLRQFIFGSFDQFDIKIPENTSVIMAKCSFIKNKQNKNTNIMRPNALS